MKLTNLTVSLLATLALVSGGCDVGNAYWGCPTCPHHTTDYQPDESNWQSQPSANAAHIVNAKCPITGQRVDKAVPTRGFENHVVGFCCPNAPLVWDTLSDEQKQSRLAAVMK